MTDSITIAALADIHVGRPNWGPYTELFRGISGQADVLLLGGDLTTLGTPEEATMLAEQLQACTIPVIGVLGNHDYTSGKQEKVRQILTDAHMQVLYDAPFEVKGVGFAGTKGFGGGFGSQMLGSFGENTIKTFVQEAVDEALQLENQLTNLETEKKVVLLHYSPIVETVMGEDKEIFPFLGSSRLVEPIDNYKVSAVFHGHAHHGSYSGKTLTGIPVYNVSYPVMQKHSPEKPYALITL